MFDSVNVSLALVWDEMKEFRSVLLSKPHSATLKKLGKLMIPPDGVKRKLDGVVDNVPPDEGYEVLDGELTEAEWDENENETVVDSDDEEGITVSVRERCVYTRGRINARK